jgi:type I restriction enzyme, S subunit
MCVNRYHNGKWKPVELGEIIDLFDSIRVPLNSQQRAERKGKYPYYGASGVIDSIDDYLFDGEYVLVAEDGENLNSRKLPVAFMARGQFWVNNHAHIIKGKKAVANDRFLIAWFAQADIKGYITGAAQPKLSQANLKRIALTAPPYPTQHKIASVLSAYDDLIENNTRRIAILEAMAQVIYQEWFVEFRFPDHEKAKLVDSPIGEIPDGWIITPLKQITTKIGSGATPRGGKEAYKSSGISLIRSLNIYDYQFDHDGLAYIDDDQAAQLDNVVVEKRDILLNITGASVARCCMAPSYMLPARVNQHVAIIRVNTKTCDPFYVLNTINNERHKRQILALAQGGATREALTKDTISNYEIVLPPLKILRKYSEVVTALFDQRELLQRKNNCLRKTRDLLLPKLISGQLDVEDLDIDTGEAMTE